MRESDIVRIAVDLRYAQNFQSFWGDGTQGNIVPPADDDEEAPAAEISEPAGQRNNRGFGYRASQQRAGMINQQRGPSAQQARLLANQYRARPGTQSALLGQRGAYASNGQQAVQRQGAGAGLGSFNYMNLQRRIQESMRDVRQARHSFRDPHHLNLFLNLNSG